MRTLLGSVAFFSVSAVLYAHETGFPLGYTGDPADNQGATCTHCHSGPPVNTVGRLTLFVSNYSPGVQQDISVHIDDNQGLAFAFQLTARLSNGAQAGSFTSTPTSQVYCANALKGPCPDGTVEYVTNTGSAPISPGHGQFVVSWTPPGRDLGPQAVTFYVAAIAGTGDVSTASGHAFAATMPVSAAPCSLTGKPAFNGRGAVVDAAASRTTLASYGLFAINGSGFFAPGAPGYSATLNDLDSHGNWPTELGCVSVTVNGTAAPIYYVSELQIRAQSISFPGSEGANVQVILNPGAPNEIKGPVFTASAAPVAPTLFTFGATGTGSAAAFDATKNADLADTSVIPSGVSASPGDLIELFGTGFGALSGNPAYVPGQFALTLIPVSNPVSVMIGNVNIPARNILYAGLAPDPTRRSNAPGLYTIVIRVPPLPSGDQRVTVTVGSAPTQGPVTIPIK